MRYHYICFHTYLFCASSVQHSGSSGYNLVLFQQGNPDMDADDEESTNVNWHEFRRRMERSLGSLLLTTNRTILFIEKTTTRTWNVISSTLAAKQLQGKNIPDEIKLLIAKKNQARHRALNKYRSEN